MDRRLEELTRTNLDDLARSFGVGGSPALSRALGVLFRSPAKLFAAQMLDMDRDLGLRGRVALRDLGRVYADEVNEEGFLHVPRDGPLLLVSNHPGMADTPLLLGSLPRDDLRVVAEDRPFLRALTNLHKMLIPIPEDRRGLSGVMRALVGHLRAGGAVLTFPAGRIEPDPLAMSGALASLESWSRSIGLAARLVPGLRVQPVCVAGVISRESLRHPLTLLRRHRLDRERLAASLQLLYRLSRPRLWPITARLSFAPPLDAASLAGTSAEETTAAVLVAVRDFYGRCIEAWGGLAG